MNKLSPYLMFNGNCEEAINFYKECFDGDIGYMGRYRDSSMDVAEDQKNKIMHVEFKFWAGSLMASDVAKGAEYTKEAQSSNIHLSLGFENLDDMKKTFATLSAGGQITLELKEQFWDSIFGMVTDQFGIQWMLSCQKQK
jgi:PhnB protein